MSAAAGLRDWNQTAGHAVEKSSPYVKRGGKWFIVHVLTPFLFYCKEVVIVATATLLTGCQNLWATVIEPFLSWAVEGASDCSGGRQRRPRRGSAGSGVD